MRFFISLLLLLIVLTSCKGQKNPYQLENKLYQCQVEYYKINGIDVKADIDSLQSYLVEKGILKGYSAKDLWDLLQISKQDDTVLQFCKDTSLKVKTFDINAWGINKAKCLDPKDSVSVKDFDTLNSPIARLVQGFENLVNTANVSPTSMLAVYANSFKVEDLSHPLCKNITLMVFYAYCKTYLFDTNLGLGESLPVLPDSKNSPQPKKENIFEIFVGAGDTLLVEGKLEKLPNLKQLTKVFIANHKPIGIVSLTTKRTTSYDFYVKVQDAIKDAYKEIRNEYALKTYSKSFDRLSKEEKQTVRKIYPQRISEAEPQSY